MSIIHQTANNQESWIHHFNQLKSEHTTSTRHQKQPISTRNHSKDLSHDTPTTQPSCQPCKPQPCRYAANHPTTQPSNHQGPNRCSSHSALQLSNGLIFMKPFNIPAKQDFEHPNHATTIQLNSDQQPTKQPRHTKNPAPSHTATLSSWVPKTQLQYKARPNSSHHLTFFGSKMAPSTFDKILNSDWSVELVTLAKVDHFSFPAKLSAVQMWESEPKTEAWLLPHLKCYKVFLVLGSHLRLFLASKTQGFLQIERSVLQARTLKSTENQQQHGSG